MSLKGALNQNGLVFFKPIWIASKIWLGRICCSICYTIHFGFNRCLLGIPWPKYDLWISHGFKADDTVSNYNVISLQVWKVCNFLLKFIYFVAFSKEMNFTMHWFQKYFKVSYRLSQFWAHQRKSTFLVRSIGWLGCLTHLCWLLQLISICPSISSNYWFYFNSLNWNHKV